jgi:hypothetical protein
MESGRKFGDNRINTGENCQKPGWLRYATDHKETLKNSTITTKVAGAPLDHIFYHQRLDASMTPDHTSIGHFLIEKTSQMYDVVDEMEIRNFTVEQSSSGQSLRELSISQDVHMYN